MSKEITVTIWACA